MRVSSVSRISRSLHLAADAAQRTRRQHAFRRGADAHIDVDAVPRGWVVKMTPATSPSEIRRDADAELADRRDQFHVAGTVEDQGRQFAEL